MRFLALAFLLFPLAACGGADDAPSDVSTAGTVDAPAGTSAAGASEGATATVANGVVTLTPAGEEMRYAETRFSAPAGSQLRLVFRNTATGAAMQHNVVILQPGTDVDAFGIAAASASATDYVPASMTGQVVAHTPMSAPGETVEVSFTVPTEPGDYVYVCTFPGHYMTMRGVMTVTPAAGA